MDFLKKWFNNLVEWVATPIAKSLDKITEWLAPIVAIRHGLKVNWTTKTAGKFALGLVSLFALCVVLGVTIVFGIVGITMVLNIVLLPLLANLLAIAAVVFVGYEITEQVRVQRAEEIIAKIEVAAAA